MRREAGLDCHATVELLPWHVNRTLEPPERQRVEAHLRDCVACAREAEFLKSMLTAMPEAGTDTRSAPPFSKLLQRINRQERAMNNWKMAAAVSLLFAVVVAVALPAYLLEPRFQTVTDARSAGETVQLTLFLREDGDPRALPKIMQRYGADLVAGPGSRNEFVLEFRLGNNENLGELKAQLRAEDDVMLEDEIAPASSNNE